MIRILRTAGRRRIPWKNGGGEAEDIATAPEGAGWDDMDWRVSRAWITASGPFSAFVATDRTFMVAEGGGVALSPAGMPVAHLDTGSPPFAFPGDVATGCRLVDGPATAFNVMSARDRWRHRVDRRPGPGAAVLTAGAPIAFAVLLRGSAMLPGMAEAPLVPGDAVRMESGDTVTIDMAKAAALACVEFWPA